MTQKYVKFFSRFLKAKNFPPQKGGILIYTHFYIFTGNCLCGPPVCMDRGSSLFMGPVSCDFQFKIFFIIQLYQTFLFSKGSRNNVHNVCLLTLFLFLFYFLLINFLGNIFPLLSLTRRWPRQRSALTQQYPGQRWVLEKIIILANLQKFVESLTLASKIILFGGTKYKLL